MDKVIHMDPVNDDPIVREEMTAKHVVRLLKKSRNRTIFLAVSQYARAIDREAVQWADGEHGRTTCAHLRVSCPQAVQFITDAYRGRNGTDCTISVGLSRHCMFIGTACQ